MLLVTEGKIKVARKRGRRRKQVMDDLRKRDDAGSDFRPSTRCE